LRACLLTVPKLGVESDAPHAFYLGAELMKAEIAWQLGKRYAQDEPLDWGCAVDRVRRMSRGYVLPATHCVASSPRAEAMAMIRETIVTTVERRRPRPLAPIGIIADDEGWIIAHFVLDHAGKICAWFRLRSPTIPTTCGCSLAA